MPDWLLVDGSSLIFRAFYGVPATFRSPDGKPVNAVRGFMAGSPAWSPTCAPAGWPSPATRIGDRVGAWT
jgi:hypothetical protein